MRTEQGWEPRTSIKYALREFRLTRALRDVSRRVFCAVSSSPPQQQKGINFLSPVFMVVFFLPFPIQQGCLRRKKDTNQPPTLSWAVRGFDWEGDAYTKTNQYGNFTPNFGEGEMGPKMYGLITIIVSQARSVNSPTTVKPRASETWDADKASAILRYTPTRVRGASAWN